MAFNKKWLIGKRIANVITDRVRSNINTSDTTIERIIFSDGSFVAFMADENDYMMYVKPIYRAARRRKRK